MTTRVREPLSASLTLVHITRTRSETFTNPLYFRWAKTITFLVQLLSNVGLHFSTFSLHNRDGWWWRQRRRHWRQLADRIWWRNFTEYWYSSPTPAIPLQEFYESSEPTQNDQNSKDQMFWKITVTRKTNSWVDQMPNASNAVVTLLRH